MLRSHATEEIEAENSRLQVAATWFGWFRFGRWRTKATPFFTENDAPPTSKSLQPDSDDSASKSEKKPSTSAPVDTVTIEKETALGEEDEEFEFGGGDANSSAGKTSVEVVAEVVNNKVRSKAATAPAAATASTTNTASAASIPTEDKSAGSNSSTSTPADALRDKFAALKRQMKQHRTPASAKKNRKTKLTRGLPPAGDGRYNKVYTYTTLDGSEITIIMHKSKTDAFAFTKPIDNLINQNESIKDGFGFDNVFFRVDANNGNEIYSVEYGTGTTKKLKFATVYHRKPSSTTSKEKREKWAKRVLVPLFNKYGSLKYTDEAWKVERFAYGADLESPHHVDYLSDFITNRDVAQVMKDDYAYSDNPLSFDDMASNRTLVEMYYGPNKVDEGIETLLSMKVTFNPDDDGSMSDPKPYQSDEE